MADRMRFQFQAGGDACGTCSGMDGQTSDGPMELPHDGCRCQVVPVSDDGDCPTWDWEHLGTERYGPGDEGARAFFEITVTCCDGTTIGETLTVDLGVTGNRTLEDEEEQIDGEGEAAAEELSRGCEGHEFNCC